jgi:hypothetical protein
MNVRMQHDRQTNESLATSLSGFSKAGKSWLSAEAELAQAEVAADGRRLAAILVLLASALGCVVAAVVLLCVFAVSLLAPYVNGLANAAGVIAAMLIILTGLIAWRVYVLATMQFRLAAILKRWWATVLNILEPVR